MASQWPPRARVVDLSFLRAGTSMLRMLRLSRCGSGLSLLGRALPVLIEQLNHRAWVSVLPD